MPFPTGTTCKLARHGEGGLMAEHLHRWQPTTAPSPLCAHGFSQPEVGSLSHLFNLVGLVTCFDQHNVAEATLCLFQADALGGLVASVFAPLEVWPRLSSEEGSHGDKEATEKRTKVSQLTASSKVPDMWIKAILDHPAAVKPPQQIPYGTHRSPPQISDPQN